MKLSRRDFLKSAAAAGAFVIVPYAPKLLAAPEQRITPEGKIYWVNENHWFELRKEDRMFGREVAVAWYGMKPKGILLPYPVEFGNSIMCPHPDVLEREYVGAMMDALWVDFNSVGKKNRFFTHGSPSREVFNQTFFKLWNK